MGFFYTNKKTQHDQSQSGQLLSSSLPPSCDTLLRLTPSLAASAPLLPTVFFTKFLLLH